MNEPCGLDHGLLGELIARRWQEDRGYYTLDGHGVRGWREAFWVRQAVHRGVELRRRRDPHPAAQLSASG